ncbi:hypothetical protein HB779_21675 (plasmid) [Phyllobacterium sp. 628]|uniref:hypothetical protein n=1 Tax=Phyllobacterium sp. 628 TaxID=2718938 RepID=UPI00166258F0|nr:hypothetical protein [Phyllobacterium sp. 628]QND54522.1 hypothetical protein HB779_21675 [Phyllobacterium sp. 628]
MKIKPPKAKGIYSDRFTDCRTALEDYVLYLMGEATVAGWSENEILMALAEIVDSTVIAHNAKARAEFDAQLAKLPKKINPK